MFPSVHDHCHVGSIFGLATLLLKVEFSPAVFGKIIFKHFHELA